MLECIILDGKWTILLCFSLVFLGFKLVQYVQNCVENVLEIVENVLEFVDIPGRIPTGLCRDSAMVNKFNYGRIPTGLCRDSAMVNKPLKMNQRVVCEPLKMNHFQWFNSDSNSDS